MEFGEGPKPCCTAVIVNNAGVHDTTLETAVNAQFASGKFPSITKAQSILMA
jgi:hypothetical protein